MLIYFIARIKSGNLIKIKKEITDYPGKDMTVNIIGDRSLKFIQFLLFVSYFSYFIIYYCPKLIKKLTGNFKCKLLNN